MKRSLVAVLLGALIASPAFAVELLYKWNKGATYRFDVNLVDRVSMEGMGGGNDVFTTKSRFALAIDKVKPNGVAQGIVYVESFDVTNAAGQRIAGLENMPRAALSSPVDIDAKGNFKFKQIVYVVKEADGTTLLVSGRNTGFGTEASASNGEEKVSVWAEFDPKTGTLKGGAKTEKLQKPKRTVAIRQDAQHIDLLPAKFLELLKLPDGDAQTGQHFTFDLMGTSTTVTVQEATAQRARIQVGSKMNVAKTMATGAAMGGAAAAADEADDTLGEPPPEMAGMMGMAGMGAMMGSGAGGPSPMTLNGDFTADFDVAKGALTAIVGTQTSDMNLGVIRIRDDATLTLTAVP